MKGFNILGAYPRTTDPAFGRKASQNWRNLKNERLGRGNNTALLLWRGLEAEKIDAFVIWLALCIERPFEGIRKPKVHQITFKRLKSLDNQWKLELGHSQSYLESVTLLRRLKTQSILMKDIEGTPPLHSLKRHLGEGFAKLVYHTLLNQKTRDALSRLSGIVKLALTPLEIEFDASFVEALRLIDFVTSRKRVTRRHIMRRFGIPRSRCDQLLQRAMGFFDFKEHVQFQKTFGKAEWIIYSGP